MSRGFALPQGAGYRGPAGISEIAPRASACHAVHLQGGTPSEVERILRDCLGVECSTLQIARGESRACVTVLTDGDVSLFRLCFSAATEFLGHWREGSLVLLSAAGGWQGAHCDSHVLRDDEVLLLVSASECWRLQPAKVGVTGVVLAPEIGRGLMSEQAHALHASASDTVRALRLPSALIGDFPDAFLSSLDRHAVSDADPMSRSEWTSLRARCIDSVRTVLRADEPRHPVGRPAASYRRLIIRTREMIQGGEHVSPTVTDLCESLHVSPRTLQYAFQKSLGISVAAYVRSVRLDRVRRTLSDPSREVPRISDVATRWGFWHPSQFSRLYFRQFGELPSETLAQARRRDSSLAAALAQ